MTTPLPEPAPRTPCRRLIYLHGFRSSPASFKARMLGQAMVALGRGADFVCPQLPASPAAAIDEIMSQIRPDDTDVLVGSSLGGYYARHVAEQCGARAVLLNPAVKPAIGLARHLGPQTLFHSDEAFDFRPEYLQALQAFAVERITLPQRYLLIAATGDEVLDWRDMVEAWPGAQHIVVQGSDHGLSDFASHIGRVLEFAGLAMPPPTDPDTSKGD